MLSLSDLLKLLDAWPTWKRIQAGPERLEALEMRISKLESALTAPGNSCPKCGNLTLYADSAIPDEMTGGAMNRVTYLCRGCGFTVSKLER